MRRSGEAGAVASTIRTIATKPSAGAPMTVPAAFLDQWQVPQSTESIAPWCSNECAMPIAGAARTAPANSKTTKRERIPIRRLRIGADH